MNWIIYCDASHPEEASRGLISFVLNGPEAAAQAMVGAHQQLLAGTADPFGDYVDVGTLAVTPKQKLMLSLSKDTITADGTDEAVLSGLPVPFTVSVNGEVILVEDGSIEFTASVPGIYTLMCSHARYFEERMTVYAL